MKTLIKKKIQTSSKANTNQKNAQCCAKTSVIKAGCHD